MTPVEIFLAKRPVFRHEEFRSLFADRHPKAIEGLLRYHVNAGHIMRLRRGLYVAIPAGSTPKSLSIDPFLVSAKMTDDAVLGYHSALEFHGKAYSVHTRFYYFSEHASLPFSFRGQKFIRVPVPLALRRSKQSRFGVQVVKRDESELHVTSLERTLVDVLDRPELAGGVEEVWRSLESVEFFDLDAIVKYTLLLKNSTLCSKVGFFLEQHAKSLMVEDKHLLPLREGVPTAPHYFRTQSRKKGRLLSKWNLIVPTEILERSWEEPQ